MKKQFVQFLLRCVFNAAGLFVASLYLKGITYDGRLEVLCIAALVLSIINALIKPFITILALPAILLTLGIFSLVINGFMVYLAHILYTPFQINNFTTAILAGLVIGLVNYMVTQVFDLLASEEK